MRRNWKHHLSEQSQERRRATDGAQSMANGARSNSGAFDSQQQHCAEAECAPFFFGPAQSVFMIADAVMKGSLPQVLSQGETLVPGDTTGAPTAPMGQVMHIIEASTTPCDRAVFELVRTSALGTSRSGSISNSAAMSVVSLDSLQNVARLLFSWSGDNRFSYCAICISRRCSRLCSEVLACQTCHRIWKSQVQCARTAHATCQVHMATSTMCFCSSLQYANSNLPPGVPFCA